MKVLLLLAAITAVCWAESCDNSFGGFLQALKDQLTSSDSVERAQEEEFRDDYRKLARQCFATSTDDSSKCALTDDELNGDVYGETGPLKGCDRCQKLAKGLRDKYMGSKEDVRKCFRQHLAQAIKEELEPCIQGKLNDYNFKVPDIPDFDEKTFKNIDVAEQGVNYRIIARSRLDACKSVNKNKYDGTQPCLENGFPGIYSKHCLAAKNARSKAVSSSCGSRFDTVKQATCQCMNEKRDDWHQRFQKIQDIVNNAASGGLNSEQCGSQISDVVGSWLNKLQQALGDCLPKDGSGGGLLGGSNGQKGDLRTLITLGCGQVINGGVKKNELTVGFRFIRLFLDALNDRLTVFCAKTCSF